MAMNKTEKARVEELETALAMHWPAYAEPEPMTREEIDAAKVQLTTKDNSVYRERRAALGWFWHVWNGGWIITRGWSTGDSHSRNNITGDNATQTGGRMYRTKVQAAMAARLELTRQTAKKLAELDHIIKDASDD